MDYQGDDNTCPACGKYFRTTQGLLAHLSSARSCLWWKKWKLANREYEEQLDVNEDRSDEEDEEDGEREGSRRNNDPEGWLYPDNGLPMEEPEDIFHFVGVQSLGEAGPGPSTASN
jgi:hypothetical protein